MERIGGEDLGQVSSIRQVAAAGLVGTVIEWYDYFIYSTAAALVFNQLFFPEFAPLTGTLLAFATFGAGFVMRPLGAAIFGHYGDRLGRKSMLVLTLFIMGGSTFLIGCLPTFETIGVWAPILLVSLRLLQGLGLGGEWGGAVSIIVEHAPRNRRGFYGSFPQIGVPAGFMLSAVAFLLVNTTLAGVSWGWRVPFLLSIVLVFVALFVRFKVEESPVFQRVRETGTEARMPVVEVFRAYPRQLALAVGTTLGFNVAGYVVLAYLLAYGTQVLGLPNNTLLLFLIIAAAIAIPAELGFSALSDRIGRRKVLLGGAVASMIMAFPFFLLVDTRSLPLVFIAILVTELSFIAMAGPVGALFSELFGTRTRYSGVSLGYQLGAIIGGSFAPFIATALYAATGTSLSVSAYMLAACAISFVSVLLITETYQKDIGETEEAEREIVAEGRDPAIG